ATTDAPKERSKSKRAPAKSYSPAINSPPQRAMPVIPNIEHARPEEIEAVYKALDALRNRKAPAEAAALVGDYLRQFPNGAPHEYALWLAIQAAIQTNDPRAAAFMTQYLDRYPAGEF